MSAFFENDGIRFHYEVIGHGDPVVFCHGLGGDADSPKDLVGTLPGRRLIVWDSRGHGQSEPVGPADKYSFSSFADDLATLLDHLDISQAIVGGISMGAAVSTQFATRRPERVKALILVRPAWLDQPLPDNLKLFPRIFELLGRLGTEQGLAEFQKLPEMEAIRASCPYTADSFCQHFTAPRAVERRIRLDRMPGDAPIRSWESVQDLMMPALVVGNDSDLIHPLAFAEQWASHLPQARLVQVPAKAHGETEHTQAFRVHLTAFLHALDA